MNREFRIAIAVFALLGTTGCQGVLDVTPKDQFPDAAVFTDPNLAQAFLNDAYRGMGHGLYEIMLASMTDETHFIHNYNTEVVVQSLITSSARGALDDGRYGHFNWGPNYARIRQTNIFLSHIDAAGFDDALKQRMKGEAYFLRAYFYHNLMRMYGGVPLITKVYGLNDDYAVARNSFKETVDFIVANADSAAALLPLSYSGTDLGRATKGAALALKARVLLYAASDLYNANPSGKPETGYATPQDRVALWRAAKDAAKAVMDLGIYGLFRPIPTGPQNAAQNYGDLFLQQMSTEVILSRFFLSTRDDGYNPGLHNGPNGFHTWGGNTPLQNVVDDYRMADGSKFDWSNPVEAAAPYANRDPRFYASIAYDGASWRTRPDDVKNLDPRGTIETFRQLRIIDTTVVAGATKIDTTLVPGLDTRDSPVENWNGAYSGYYLRKFIDPSINAQFTKEQVPWIFFRYAEVLLNYAEASIELNEVGDALTVLNQIRRRAGMPDLVAGPDLRDEYRNERRVEMAFEEQRFFDTRRWMIAPQVLNKDAFGINIFADGKSPTDRSTWRNYRYETHSIQHRAWDNKMYFMPIPRDELNRNPLLSQNPGF
ncbi:MAG TPA: RagB/SusD family nutrient uptake outer membrane protein [Gemmatimonadales bacterium]|nr:RagB/SusD family nutrient uptake outer membrane protein [Gemmatimonadales bacterium]